MVTKTELIEDWSSIPDILLRLHKSVSDYEVTQPVFPGDPGSQASVERSRISDQAKLSTVFAQSAYLTESAGDHLSATAALLAPPVRGIAVYGCVRNLLEASAKALWLLDPTVDEVERIGRSFGMRYHDLKEQEKLARSDQGNSQADCFRDWAEARIRDLDKEASEMGYTKLRDRKTKKKITGIGRNKPDTVDLCDKYLGCGGHYRLLSGVTHGQFSVVHSLAFQEIEDDSITWDPDARPIIKKPDDGMIVHMSDVAFMAFGRTVWQQANYCGWETDTLRGVFEQCADGLATDPEWRFWNCDKPRGDQ